LHWLRGKPARLVIADDHELARAGLRAMLTDQRGFELVGEASNGQEALQLCRRLRPDLALLDVRMPQMDGLTTCRAIKQECAATSVILITMHANTDYLFEALKAGAAGYVLKDLSQRELITTVQKVMHRDAILNQDLMARLRHRLATETHTQQATTPA